MTTIALKLKCFVKFNNKLEPDKTIFSCNCSPQKNNWNRNRWSHQLLLIWQKPASSRQKQKITMHAKQVRKQTPEKKINPKKLKALQHEKSFVKYRIFTKQTKFWRGKKLDAKYKFKFSCWGDVCLVRVISDNNWTRLPIQFGIRVWFLRAFISPFCICILDRTTTRAVHARKNNDLGLIAPHWKFRIYKWFSRFPNGFNGEAP